jgi:hypothetical protein
MSMFGIGAVLIGTGLAFATIAIEALGWKIWRWLAWLLFVGGIGCAIKGAVMIVRSPRDPLYAGTLMVHRAWWERILGVYPPEPKNLQNHRIKIQIGTSNTFIDVDSPTGDIGVPFSEMSLKLPWDSAKHQLVVSAKIVDSNNNVLVLFHDGLWDLGKTDQFRDFNYDDDSVEVINAQNHVVFQIRLLPDSIQLQGESWGWTHITSTGEWKWRGWRWAGTPSTAVTWGCYTLDKKSDSNCSLPNDPTDPVPEIKPIFRYPSSLYLGQLVDKQQDDGDLEPNAADAEVNPAIYVAGLLFAIMIFATPGALFTLWWVKCPLLPSGCMVPRGGINESADLTVGASECSRSHCD